MLLFHPHSPHGHLPHRHAYQPNPPHTIYPLRPIHSQNPHPRRATSTAPCRALSRLRLPCAFLQRGKVAQTAWAVTARNVAIVQVCGVVSKSRHRGKCPAHHSASAHLQRLRRRGRRQVLLTTSSQTMQGERTSPCASPAVPAACRTHWSHRPSLQNAPPNALNHRGKKEARQQQGETR